MERLAFSDFFLKPGLIFSSSVVNANSRLRATQSSLLSTAQLHLSHSWIGALIRTTSLVLFDSLATFESSYSLTIVF